MKICHVVFSTNRLEFLQKTLESLKYVDYSGLEVYHLLIEDYPLHRNHQEIIDLVINKHGFNEIIFHSINKGITRSWQEFFDLINEMDFDYILHNEDDVELLMPIKVTDLINILQYDTTLSQIQLKRNAWYAHEKDYMQASENDCFYGDFRYEKNTDYFWMLMSLYPSWIAKQPFFNETGYNPSEYVIAKYLNDKFSLSSGILKTINGDNIVNHIGNYSNGIRVMENEPGWESFKRFDKNKKYCSKTGEDWSES